MGTLRFIHCADLHLDRPFHGLEDVPSEIAVRVRESTFQSFHRIVDTAITRNVDFIIISGDLFDDEDRSIRAQARFRDEMSRLAERGIEAFVIHGNHDSLSGNWLPLAWPENVRVFGPEVEVFPFEKNGEVLAHLYGFSYPQRAVTEKMIRFYEKKPGARFHIGMLHGQAEGNGDHASYAPFTVHELLEKEFDYWALGHIHKHQLLAEEPPIVYPGNIQGLNPKETGEKGCMLVEMDGNEVNLSMIPTAGIQWQSCEISISGLTSIDQLLEVCENELESLRREKTGMFVELCISGNGPLHTYFHEEENIEDVLAALREGEETEENFIWPVSCRLQTMPEWDRDRLVWEDHFVGDLLRLIDQEGAGDALSSLFTKRKVKRYLPGFDEYQQKEILKEAENLLLTELLREGEASEH